jgi:hypothetical protein
VTNRRVDITLDAVSQYLRISTEKDEKRRIHVSDSENRRPMTSHFSWLFFLLESRVRGSGRTIYWSHASLNFEFSFYLTFDWNEKGAAAMRPPPKPSKPHLVLLSPGGQRCNTRPRRAVLLQKLALLSLSPSPLRANKHNKHKGSVLFRAHTSAHRAVIRRSLIRIESNNRPDADPPPSTVRNPQKMSESFPERPHFFRFVCPVCRVD